VHKGKTLTQLVDDCPPPFFPSFLLYFFLSCLSGGRGGYIGGAKYRFISSSQKKPRRGYTVGRSIGPTEGTCPMGMREPTSQQAINAQEGKKKKKKKGKKRKNCGN